MSVSFMKHYYNFSIIFYIILRSISGTSEVDISVIISDILEHQKTIVKFRLYLNKSTESTSTTAFGKLFQILTILLIVNENFLRS